MADNSITIVGNLTRDPEIRYTSSGQANARLGIAVSRRWQNRQTNEWEERTSFFNVVAWGDMAENISDTLGKGNRVIVNGRLEQRSWETDQGEKRSVVEVVADEIGPSLRWATAEVKRSERRGGGGQGGGGGDFGGAARSGGGSNGGGANAGGASPGGSPGGGGGGGGQGGNAGGGSGGGDFGYDEEPF
jgi:single-strand DNA-binding protein